MTRAIVTVLAAGWPVWGIVTVEPLLVVIGALMAGIWTMTVRTLGLAVVLVVPEPVIVTVNGLPGPTLDCVVEDALRGFEDVMSVQGEVLLDGGGPDVRFAGLVGSVEVIYACD